jgi:hypothetical protein
MSKFFYTFLLVCMTGFIYAQGFGSIFRAGLTTSTFRGSVLQDAQGGNLEQLGYVSGFHLGTGLRYKFDYAEKYGLNIEVVYTQKGGRIQYNGPSYFVFRNNDGRSEIVNGNRDYILDISTSHIDFPVSFFVKLFNKLEVNAGFYFSTMLRAEGGGSFTFNSGLPQNVDMTVFLDQNYRKNNIPDYSQPFTGETIPVRINGEPFPVPKTQGAYFEHTQKTGNMLRSIDYGLTGGLAYYITKGLYLSGRVQYGMNNQFNPDMFISLKDLNGTVPALRNDLRKNLSFQLAIGFAF